LQAADFGFFEGEKEENICVRHLVSHLHVALPLTIPHAESEGKLGASEVVVVVVVEVKILENP
jgi:hypothetical protein